MSEHASPFVHDVSEADFATEVLERSKQKPVLVDFWAAWCGPCRMLGPLLEKIVAARNGEIELAKVDVEASQNLAMQFQVSSIPLVLAFRDGKVVDEFMGLLPEPQLQAFVERLLPSASDRLAAQALKLEPSDPTKAEALYRQALAIDQRDEPALVGLARLLIAQGRGAEAGPFLEEVGSSGELGAEADKQRAILSLHEQAHGLPAAEALKQRVQSEPKNGRACYELGCVLAAQGDYPQALAMLLTAGERDMKLAPKEVREAMVKIFNVIGQRSPLADEYRVKLTTLLY